MRFCLTVCAALAALCLASMSARASAADGPPKSEEAKQTLVPAGSASAKTAPQAVEKALDFVVKDTAKWRKERGCATCHHGAMTVWTLNEAKAQGYTVAPDTLTDVTAWTKEHFMPRIGKPRDPRFGWNLVSIPAIYLGVMTQNLPILSRDETRLVADHLARHQEDDGAFLLPPANNGPPPTWESREIIAQLALLAWEPAVAPASREKTIAWLKSSKPTETTQSKALQLLLDIRTGKLAEQIQQGTDALLKRQNADGGWSPRANLPSDGYATGQVLWVLSFAGLEKDRPEIARAVAFLVATQQENGSWPMTSRDHSGAAKKKFAMPIVYFGSAWATLGLVRWVAPALDPAAREKLAFDEITRFSGKFDVDAKIAGKPVVRVEIRFELDDEDLASLAAKLAVFPQLATLEFKSPKLTDAGLVHLRALSQVRHLTLENGAITDAALAHLKELSYLETLNLKGTKITDAAVQELEKALPKAKVQR